LKMTTHSKLLFSQSRETNARIVFRPFPALIFRKSLKLPKTKIVVAQSKILVYCLENRDYNQFSKTKEAKKNEVERKQQTADFYFRNEELI